MLCRAGGIAFALSEDHKPAQDRETHRIYAAGGFVNEVGHTESEQICVVVDIIRYQMTQMTFPLAAVVKYIHYVVSI